MKTILSAVLGLTMIVAPAFAQAPAAPAPTEFNFAMCSGDGFTREHVVEATKNGKTTLTFTDYLVSSTEVKHDDNPDVWIVDKTETSKAGDIEISASMKVEDKVVDMIVFIHKKRAIATISYDGHLSVALYGGPGLLADLTNNADQDLAACGVLHQMESKDVPEVLLQYLQQDDVPTAPIVSNPAPSILN